VLRFLRVVGATLIAIGAAALAWAALVWKWEDPFTAAVTWYEQRQLADAYDDVRRSHAPSVDVLDAWRQAQRGGRTAETTLAVVEQALRAEAARYRRGLRPGEPVGRLRIRKLGLDVVAVEGTDKDSLKKGPGRHRSTAAPGEGELVYVAGHRTTYGAPFSHIDRLQRGDRVMFELPYATFEYAVTGRRIVPATYIQALRSRGREEIALQACWPRFFASHRIIVYAAPVRVVVPGEMPLVIARIDTRRRRTDAASV
jgi:sortase A